jgi:hypothetical protein
MLKCVSIFAFASASLFALSVSSAYADDTASAVADKIATANTLIEQGLDDAVGLKFVEDMTTKIGPRLAGSEAEQRARNWAVAELNALGFQNVRVEAFSIPFWSRTHESASISGANPQPLVITALGGSRPTPEGGLTAEIVRFESLSELAAAPADSVTGRIVFIDEHMTRTQDGSGYGMAVRKRGACAKVGATKGAVACLIRSVGTQPHRMPHTGGMMRTGALGDLPAAAVSHPDADQLTRLLSHGPVSVNLDIGVEYSESAASGNVIAEVEGGAHKDEIVLIGCHLDSWDLGTGAVDDGAGCGIIVGAANLINQLSGTPDRTIRVVLYGAEEVGLFGGDAYARKHTDNLSNHVFAAESDFGAGRIWRLQTGFGDGALDYAATMQSVLEPLGIAPSHNRATGGPDIGVLHRAGVPVVTPTQDGTDYFDLHHTPDDTFDKIEPDAFNQNVAAYAAMAYLAADTGWDFRKAATSDSDDE